VAAPEEEVVLAEEVGGGQQCGCARTTEYMGVKITSVSGAGV
jgi:hypothetical protein